MKVGFIGYGSMGSMLVNKFVEYGALKPEEIVISTRTDTKLENLRSKWTDISIAKDNIEVAQKAKYIFICVKPLEVKNILTEIQESLTKDSHIISIAGPVKINNIEEITVSKVTKITPSLISEVGAGITLVCHSNSVEPEEADYIDSLLNKISIIKRISEDDFELSAELTSCMPGFIASIFQELTDSAKHFNNALSDSDINEMIAETLYGTAKLFKELNMSFQDAIDRVATRGGITEEGVKVFQSRLPAVFNEMFKATLNKRKIVNEKVERSFENH